MITTCHISDLTSATILAIPPDAPERLYCDPEQIKSDWHALSARWHPDFGGSETEDRTAVMQHINALYAEACRRIAGGTYVLPDTLRLTATDGRQFNLRYLRQSPFELGTTYLGKTTLAYGVDVAATDLFTAAVATIGGLTFADPKMATAMTGRLPAIKATVETAAHQYLLLHRQPDNMALADLLARAGGRLDPRHVAWIISGLEHIVCYLDWAGLMHGGIGLDSVYITQRHRVALLGGWWYTHRFGQPLAALPEGTAKLLPRSASAPHAHAALDLECIRQVGRDLLGDTAGTRLLHKPDVPKPLAHWLISPPAVNAYVDFKAWETAREASFGPRNFIKLDDAYFKNSDISPPM
jgi:hypothetical protein